MNQPGFTARKILVLLILLAVPGSLYYLLKAKGENRYKPLAIYGPKKPADSFHSRRGKQIRDTIYHQIRPFELTDQDGRSAKFPADSTQITVVNFFYTRCPSFCPRMNDELARIARIFNGNRIMRFLSVSVDPAHDTPPVLKQYSKKYEVNAKWDFLTGDSALVRRIAIEDFLVDAIRDTTATHNIIHSPMLILVDSQRRIRGYYDSTGGGDQTNLLIDEIKVLIAEELRNVKDR